MSFDSRALWSANRRESLPSAETLPLTDTNAE